MNSMNASEAREKLYRLLDETANAHQPVLITGPRGSAIREIKITKAEKDALGAQITLNKGRVKHRLPNGDASGTIAFGQTRFNLDLWKIRKLSNIKTKQV